MAKPIELGLVLEGEDAARFEEYLSNPPELPRKGKKLVERVKKTAASRGLL